MTPREKRCPRCGQVKPPDEFGRDRHRRDGRSCYCRPCARARAKIDNARRAAAKRAWEKENDRGACPQCGGLMAVGTRRRGYKMCRSCRDKANAASTHALFTRIAEMWNQGLPRRVIAERIGTTDGTIQVYLAGMRKLGWNVPLRRPSSRKVAA